MASFAQKAALVAALLAATAGFAPATASAQPPAPTLTGTPANPSGSAAPSFAYTTSYAGVSFQCQLDAAGYAACPGFSSGGSTSGTQSYGGLGDGAHTFDARSVDLFGNPGPSTSYSWTADLVAPVLSLPSAITVQSPLGRSAYVPYNVSANDNHDPTPSLTCDHARTGGTFALGTATVHCNAVDFVGNSASGSFSVSVVDTTAPKAPVLTSRPTSPTAVTAPSFSYQANEAATFTCRLDGAAFGTCSSPTAYTGLTDGSHTFAVYATDTSGNVGPTATYTWTLDTVAPTLTLPAPITVESPTGTAVAVAYAVSATDNHDPNPKLSCTYPKNGAAFALGVNTVSCTATDSVGNSATNSFMVTVQDTTPPKPPSISGPANPSGNASPSFWYWTNEAATFECSLDNAAFASCGQSSTSYSALADGSHTFQVRATDNSGNLGPAASFTWLTDLVGPTLSLPGPLTAQSPRGDYVHVPYGVGATDNHDPNPYVSCTYGTGGSWFPVGITTVTCTAYDLAGNSSTSGSFTVTVVDTVPPDAPNVNGPQDPSNNASPSFSFSTNEWNVSWECNLDGAGFSSCSQWVTFSGLADGTHTLEVRATDASGNVSAASTYTWTIDTMPPLLNLPAPPTAQSPLGNYVHVDYLVTATDDRDPNPYVYCSYGTSGSWFTVGVNTVTCTAHDKAGNSSTGSFTVTVVDTTPPKPPNINGPQAPSNNASPSFSFWTNEWNVTWECNLDGAGFSSCSQWATFSSLADGNHTLEVRATDMSGNVGAASTYSWSIDTVAPVITVPASPVTADSPVGGYVPVAYAVSATDNTDPSPNVYCSAGSRAMGWFTVGTTTVTCYAHDVAGNSASASFDVVVSDATAPDAPTVYYGPANPTNSSSASFYFWTNEWNATFECSLDGAAYSPCTSWATGYSGLADGTHVFRVRATDVSNNVGAPTAYTWTIDSTPPVVTVPASLTIESPDGSDVAAFYTVSAVDNVDPNPVVSCDHGDVFPLGVTTVACIASDNAGNTSASTTFVVTVQDTTPPDAPTIDLAPSNPTASSSATLGYFTNEAGASFYCSLDGAASSPCGPTVTYNGLTDGTHTFDVYAIDASGNVGATTSVSGLVDLVAPSLTAPPQVSVESPLGGVATVSYSVEAVDNHDANPAIACDHGTRTGGSFPLGSTSVICTATDLAGNSASASFTVTVVDTTSPAAPAVSGPSDPSNDASPTIGYSSNEQNASFECNLDGAGFAACPANSVTYNGLADGIHNLEVRAIDSSGNVGAVASHSWTIDLVAPVLTVPAPAPVESPLGDNAVVNYTVSAADNHDANPVIVCDKGDTTGGTFPLGATVVTCTASDAVGNPSAQQSFTVTVADTTSPAAPAVSGPSDPSNDASPAIGYSTNEQNATFECNLDGAGFAACPANSVTYNGLADGIHNLEVRAIDSSGNVGASAGHTWTIDLVAPVLTVPATVNAESAFGGVVPVAYVVSAADNHDPGPTITCDHGDASGGAFGLGTTAVTCTAADAVGNRSAPQSFDVVVADTTAPAAPALSGPSDPSNDASPTIGYSTNEQNASFECNLDGAGFAACPANSVTYNGLADGIHNLEVRAIDSSGNVGAVATHNWRVDTTAPTTAITGRPDDPSVDPVPSFSFTASEAATFECQLDGGGFVACTSPVSYAGPAPGAHTFDVRATDAAGNVGSPVSYTWTQG